MPPVFERGVCDLSLVAKVDFEVVAAVGCNPSNSAMGVFMGPGYPHVAPEQMRSAVSA